MGALSRQRLPTSHLKPLEGNIMRLEPKPAPTLAVTLLFPIAAIVATLLITSLLVLAAGASPLSVFYLVAKGAAGSQFALLETLTRATPLIFTGLAVAVAFRAKLWNIGAEAQLYVGGIVTVVLGTGALPLPSIVLIPVIMLVAMIAGGLLLLGPAALKTRFGVDEVVTTSSTPKRVFSTAGPSSSNAPAAMTATMMTGMRMGAGKGSAPVPSTTVTMPPT